ncbi:MAG: IS3 family transposase [Erysipelotrichaceae bacterium]|nr:IS3 family transposase [Erysipelotrichaceae bacterium]
MNALGNALVKRGNKENRLIFHDDRGCQYCSKKYQKMLVENNIEGSMSKGGCPYDNSCMESFFASRKKECFYRKKYSTIEEVEKDLFYYIEIFYNRKRLHSSLGYMSLVGYRMKEAGIKAA